MFVSEGYKKSKDEFMEIINDEANRMDRLIDDLLMKQQMDHDKETLRKERGLEESVKMPSQKDVNDFFSDTFDEIHYLNSKPVEDWDEYDLSNWAARVRKSKERGKASYDGVAMREYGVPYDELSEREKEWVRDKIDMNRGVMEEVNEDIQPLAVEKLTDKALLDMLNNIDDMSRDKKGGTYDMSGRKMTRAQYDLAKSVEAEVRRREKERGLKIHYVDNERYEFMESVEEELFTPN